MCVRIRQNKTNQLYPFVLLWVLIVYIIVTTLYGEFRSDWKMLGYGSAHQDKTQIQVDTCPETRCFPHSRDFVLFTKQFLSWERLGQLHWDFDVKHVKTWPFCYFTCALTAFRIEISAVRVPILLNIMYRFISNYCRELLSL